MNIPPQIYTQTKYPARWLNNIHYFGISPRLVEGKTRRFTGKWCKIESASGSIYRVIRFQPHFSAGKNGTPAQIAFDYDGWLTLLGDNPFNSLLELKIRKARIHEYLLATLFHPDPTFRLASWLGAIALGVSLISIAISFMHK
jgi:hypothetical protein